MEQVKGYGKFAQNMENFSTTYWKNYMEVGIPDYVKSVV